MRSTSQEAVVGIQRRRSREAELGSGSAGGAQGLPAQWGSGWGREGGSEGNSYIKNRLVGSGGQWEEVPQAESERLVLPVVCWGLLTVEPSGGGSKSRAGLGYAGDVLIL